MNIYEFLWLHTTGRPWTYVIRDLWHRFEFVWIVILIAAGVTLGHNFDWIEVLKIMGIFTLGFILGHCFWGKEYVPDQH